MSLRYNIVNKDDDDDDGDSMVIMITIMALISFRGHITQTKLL